MVKLSVNINKVALIRNSRGENQPNLVEFVKKAVEFGAHGVTVHPRPDERHIRYADVYEIKDVLSGKGIEFNVEGYPTPEFIKMMEEVKPDQCTLVPDKPGALTSDSGWDTRRYHPFLHEIILHLQNLGIRTSLFLNPDVEMVKYASKTLTDRVEFYTGPYAKFFPFNQEKAIEPYLSAALVADELEIDINAGHDLNLQNLPFLVSKISSLQEVSIGHALVSDCLYLGLKETIHQYLHCLKTT